MGKGKKGIIYTAGLEKDQLKLELSGGRGGFQEPLPPREKENNELDKFTDMIDSIEDQRFGGRVGYTNLKS